MGRRPQRPYGVVARRLVMDTWEGENKAKEPLGFSDLQEAVAIDRSSFCLGT